VEEQGLTDPSGSGDVWSDSDSETDSSDLDHDRVLLDVADNTSH
jgi:hypothetical protein